MAEDLKPHRRRLSPPALARALLALAAAPADRAALIGDLEEEFAAISGLSRHRARAWYWRQAALSAPHLLARRFASPQARRFAVTALAAVAAFALVRYWDVAVARKAARAFYATFQSPSYAPARMVYLAVQAAGFALAGGGVAGIAFARSERFLKNLQTRLAPAAVLLFAPALIGRLAASDAYPLGFRLAQTGLAAGAFIAGAWIAARLRRRRRP